MEKKKFRKDSLERIEIQTYYAIMNSGRFAVTI